jgi:hypothetical protein
MQANYDHLPENWQDLSHQEKSIWLARHAINYTREGEISGVREEIPEDVMQAYQTFLHEEKE